MLNLNDLTVHTSRLVYIAGVPHINVHVHYVDEKEMCYNSMDIKYKDSIPKIEQCLGFEADEQLQILALVDKQKEILFSMAKEQGIVHVKSEEEFLRSMY